MSIEIDNIVNVNVSLVETGVLRRDFGRTLFVTTDNTLPSSRAISVYASIDDVKSEFPLASEPYKAAAVYFQQVPYPKNLMIGRWFNSDYAANLVGGKVGTLSDLTAVTTGAFAFEGTDVTGLDFSSATSYSDVATVISSALTGFTCTFDSIKTAFVVTKDTAGAADITYFSAPTSGTDISSLLKMSNITASELNPGLASQTIEEAMAKFQELNNTFYFITLDATYKDTSTVIDLANWTESREYFYFAESSSNQALATNDDSSIFAQLFADGAGSGRVAGDWTPAVATGGNLVVDYLSVSSCGRLSSVDFSGTNTLINPKFKARPDIQPSILTTSQQNELLRKRVNFYTSVGGDTISPTVQNIYVEGTSFKNGVWQDMRYGNDWLANAIKVDIFNLLLRTNRISQTDADSTMIQNVIISVLKQGVKNGLLAGGKVTESTKANIISVTGRNDFDGLLPSGYLVYFQPYSEQSYNDRVQRKSSNFYVWAKGAGAVNSIRINVTVEQ